MKDDPRTIKDMGDSPSAAMQKSRRDTVALVLVATFLVLAAQLFRLQILGGEAFAEMSARNRTRITAIAAPRGDILDASGSLLVTSRPSFSVYYWYTEEEEAEAVLGRLATILGTDIAQIQRRVLQYKGRYFEPIPIAADISEEQHTAIAENAPDLRGVFVEPEPIRYYPHGGLMSPILGYVGEIADWQLEDQRYEDYRAGHLIGMQGLESFYEADLRGQFGGYQVEVDYLMRPTGNKGPGYEPVPGKSLVLNIELPIQEAAEEALYEALSQKESAKGGAAVVLDVKTGGVRAMASVPSFDPNKLVTGISQGELDELVSSGEWVFSDLASTGLYPPGSTFKIVTAIAALAEGKTTLDEKIFDPGYHPMAPSLVCNRWGGHGSVDFFEALQVSCNVYFYEMGRRLGADAIAQYARALGLGAKTGIDLYGENYGTVPDSKWKAKAYSEGRVAEPEVLFAEHMMIAMGQTFHLDTPLQMASMVQAIANKGVRMKPYLVKEIILQDGEVVTSFLPEVAGVLSVEGWVLDSVRRGMQLVTWSPGGTAYGSFYDMETPVAGKTGTAENPLGENHGWFVGFAPVDDPEIAIAVVVDQGGGGSEVAAPVARAILDAYFAPDKTDDTQELSP